MRASVLALAALVAGGSMASIAPSVVALDPNWSYDAAYELDGAGNTVSYVLNGGVSVKMVCDGGWTKVYDQTSSTLSNKRYVKVRGDVVQHLVGTINQHDNIVEDRRYHCADVDLEPAGPGSVGGGDATCSEVPHYTFAPLDMHDSAVCDASGTTHWRLTLRACGVNDGVCIGGVPYTGTIRGQLSQESTGSCILHAKIFGLVVFGSLVVEPLIPPPALQCPTGWHPEAENPYILRVDGWAEGVISALNVPPETDDPTPAVGHWWAYATFT